MTQEMVEYVDIPMAYLIGMGRELWSRKRVQEKIVAGDVVVFDVDNGQFGKCADDGPAFPPAALKELHAAAQAIQEERDSVGKTMKLKSAILKLYLDIMGNFSDYYEQNATASHCFKTEEYLNNLKPEAYPFMKEFVRTNLFLEFAEKTCGTPTADSEQFYAAAKAVAAGSTMSKEVFDAVRSVSKGLMCSQRWFR